MFVLLGITEPEVEAGVVQQIRALTVPANGLKPLVSSQSPLTPAPGSPGVPLWLFTITCTHTPHRDIYMYIYRNKIKYI